MQGKVLITGCSSGIGRATALLLAKQGIPVLATARRLESLEGLEQYPNISVAELDVTKPDQCRSVVEQVGPFWGLVNNAGYGLMGPSEELMDKGLREQFETNFFGMVRLCGLVLPQMRKQGKGTIINVGSVMGKLTFPMSGAYSATKYAMEAYCDTLRVEVAPFGVKVVLLEPGSIETRFKANVETVSLPFLEEKDSPYFEITQKVIRAFQKQSGVGLSPDHVARVIAKILTKRNPRARYVITHRARIGILFRHLLPDRIWDFIISKSFGLR